MRLTRLWRDCPDTESCPTLYWTDRGTAVVQGYVVTDPETVGAPTLAAGETAVEVPLALAHTSLLPELTRIAGDFWLIDGREVVAMYYQRDGQFRAAEILDASQGAEHRTAAVVSWELGIDFTTWWNDHPQHHRCAHRVA